MQYIAYAGAAYGLWKFKDKVQKASEIIKERAEVESALHDEISENIPDSEYAEELSEEVDKLFDESLDAIEEAAREGSGLEGCFQENYLYKELKGLKR